MLTIDVLRILFWMLRGKETDIIKIYNYVTPVIQLANGGQMLNRGYWDKDAKNPLQAQHQFCKLVGEFAEYDSAKTLLDVGSGISIPAIHWSTLYEFLNITCLDINFQGLKFAARESKNIPGATSMSTTRGNSLSLINGSATDLPFSKHSIDRIVAVESAHHFRPLEFFIRESKRVLVEKGWLIFTTPIKSVMTEGLTNLTKFGIVSLCMPSKSYQLENLESTITNGGFQIKDVLHIGSKVYEPLTNYYIQNRKMLRDRILKKYPSFVESLLYKSVLKTAEAYQKGILDYVLIKCRPM